jgi:serine/threonine-protein kinase
VGSVSEVPRWVHRQTRPTLPPTTRTDAARPGLSALEPGLTVRHRKAYEIVDLVGEGGMGMIFRAYDPDMDRYVALKVLKPGCPEAVRRRFRREATIAADFSHPNLLRVLDVGSIESSETEWMTMEYLRGRDLGHVLESGRRTSIPLLVDLFAQTLDALDYIHARRIVHCDVKPDNIFVTRDPYNRRLVVAKLIDFGIARSLEPPLELQQDLSGDPRYMAPEQTVLNGVLDARADLYALGLTLFEMVTGQHPFEAYLDAPFPKLLALQCDEDPVPPSDLLEPEVPDAVAEALDEIVFTATAKDPAARYANAKEMKKAVAGLLDVT